MIRQLLGDLAVASVELVEKPRPPFDMSVIMTFHRWYEHMERWLHVAIDAGIAARGEPPPADLVALVAAPFEDSRMLAALVDAVYSRFDYIGYEEGFLYGAIDWVELCTARSAFELVRDLLAAYPALVAELDTSDVEDRMAHWGFELFSSPEPPPGIPVEHWWWFRDKP